MELMNQTLYTYPANNRAMMALIAAQYNGVYIHVPEFAMGTENKTEEFLKMNPNGKVPTLKTPEGAIFESTAIARYVARMRNDTGLLGATFFQQAQVDEWIDWATTELISVTNPWLYTIFGFFPPNPKVVEQAKENTKKPLAILNGHLAEHTFLVGERITLADIVMVCQLLYPMKFLFAPEYRAAYPSLMRWFNTCVNQKEFLAVMGPVELAEVSMALPAAPKKEKKEKKEQPKKEQPKKEEKKEEKKEAPAEAPAKKAKNPLDLLPATPFDLDNWKRIYSNTHSDFYSVMDQFWPLYDKEGWSLWICDYKYNEENKKGFMTANLVGGFIQRSDSLRKYAFGNMSILKSDSEEFYRIKGAWLIRGHDIQPMLDENPDAPYYEWKRVNEESEEDKKELADLWCASETIDGLEINSNEVFK